MRCSRVTLFDYTSVLIYCSFSFHTLEGEMALQGIQRNVIERHSSWRNGVKFFSCVVSALQNHTSDQVNARASLSIQENKIVKE